MNPNRKEALVALLWFIEIPRIWPAPTLAKFYAEREHGQPAKEIR